jgi:hypothetical protein
MLGWARARGPFGLTTSRSAGLACQWAGPVFSEVICRAPAALFGLVPFSEALGQATKGAGAV